MMRLPLTDSQMGLLAVDGRVPTREIYNQVIWFEIDPAIDGRTVAAALVGLVTVQPALRQVFGLRPEMHARLTPPPDAAELPLSTAELAPEYYEQAVADWAVRLGRPAFELTSQPPWRAGYLRAADGRRAAILLVIHHIVGDGMSLGPIARDLESALAGKLTPDRVESLRVTREAALARELRAQIRVSADPGTAQRAAAWAQRLREIPAQVLCPRPGRPAETDFAGARLGWLLTAAQTQAVADTAARLEVTPFVLFGAVYSAVLGRHTGAATVLIGSPFVARRTVAAFDLCGFFVNTLPIAVDIDWARPFAEHASQTVRAAVDHCRANVEVAFSQIVAEVQPDRSTNRNPLFSAMLAMQDTFEAKDSTGLIKSVREPGNGTAKFDLWLGATPVDGCWLLEIEYDTALISPAAADDLLGSVRRALRTALADPGVCLADLFTDASVATSRRTDGYPAPVPVPTLAEWVDSAAARRPDAVAIEDQTGTLRHAELAAAARQAAAGLAGLGVRPGDVVGVSPDTLSGTATAMLAILRCGAAYLPLDPSLPPERLRYMVRQAGCRIAVGAALVADGLRVVSLPELTGDDSALPPLRAEHPAYVMFTSGSTGQPKGVLMGQGPLLNLSAWQIAALRMDETTRFMQYAPLGFDVSFQEIVPTLAAGGAVISREPADRRDFPALVHRLAAAQVSHVYLPVAALRPFVQCARALRIRLPALRYVCVSGEQLLVDDQVKEFFADHPHCQLVNLYGPTETHAVTTHRLRGAEPNWPEHVPIGLPMHGVHGYVVDVTGHLAPVGVPGELYLGGLCPAQGYINDTERTAALFVPDTFAGSGTMYRTGDRVISDSDGVLVFLGRDDTQVKVRGYRIELGEIEAVANAVPGVRQAIAAPRGSGADRDLVLFVLAADGVTVDHAEVAGRLRQALPGYMLPARIFAIEKVPVTGAGKTDRDALLVLAARQAADEAAAAGAATAPEYADDLERELAELWSQTLGVSGIERDRPVIDYGAHSLNIVTVLAEVGERYDIAPPIIEFLRSPTIATLAELVRAGQR
jgi:amino acid adenylation domain-containing protein